MNENDSLAFQSICKEIAASTPPGKSWEWDDRFGAALIVLEKKDAEKVFSAVINQFMSRWDASTVSKASRRIRSIIKKDFDLRPGQLIFTTDENLSTILLAAWWPWGNDSSISMRVTIFPADRNASVREGLLPVVKKWFNL
jgi:hypothetical protein